MKNQSKIAYFEVTNETNLDKPFKCSTLNQAKEKNNNPKRSISCMDEAGRIIAIYDQDADEFEYLINNDGTVKVGMGSE